MRGDRLRKRRDELWHQFNSMPRRESFSGIYVANELDKIQQKLDKIEGKTRSVRYYPTISIEVV